MTDTAASYAPGTRWCAVVSYFDGSAIRGVFGPYLSKSSDESASRQLREIGVYPEEEWKVMPLRRVDPGTAEVTISRA